MAKKPTPKKTPVYATDDITRRAFDYRGKPLPEGTQLPEAGEVTEGCADIATAFEALHREHAVAMHVLLMRLLTKTHAPAHMPFNIASISGSLHPMAVDVLELMNEAQRNGTPVRGITVARAERTYVPLRIEDAPDGGGKLLKSGKPQRTTDRPEGAIGIMPAAETMTTQVLTRWVDEFTAEVDECRHKFADDPALPMELDRLTAALPTLQWQPNTRKELHASFADDAPIVERTLARTTDRLVGRLKELSGAATSEGARLTWLGGAGELSRLIHELADNGWIKKMSAERQANLVVQVFKKDNGSQVCTPGTMKTNLVNRGLKDPGDMVDLEVPKNKKPQ